MKVGRSSRSSSYLPGSPSDFCAQFFWFDPVLEIKLMIQFQILVRTRLLVCGQWRPGRLLNEARELRFLCLFLTLMSHFSYHFPPFKYYIPSQLSDYRPDHLNLLKTLNLKQKIKNQVD